MKCAASVVAILMLPMFGCGPKVVALPKFEKKAMVWLSQNWTSSQSSWFHHADQGTQTIPVPLEWFVALQQPAFFFPGKFSDSTYLDRYGFISTNEEVDGATLPIGFATGTPFREPDGSPMSKPGTGQPWTRVGLTCAACHTGRLDFGDVTYLIDGGPAITNLPAFQENLIIALGMTKQLPWRLAAFEKAVLGMKPSDSAKLELIGQIDSVIGQSELTAAHEVKVGQRSVPEGYGRLDALTRIGNTVFALDMARSHDPNVSKLADQNFEPETAPVHYPRIWDASWFQWVQYDGSIEQPMVRNAGESFGVDSWINLVAAGSDLFLSDTNVQALADIESALAGTVDPHKANTFNGLRAPRYPRDVQPLPLCSNANIRDNDDTCVSTAEIAPARIERGRKLYTENCESCHLPPITSKKFWSNDRWNGGRFLDLRMLAVEDVGTDPAQADGMMARKVDVPGFLQLPRGSGGKVPFGTALGDIVAKAVDQWYDRQTPPTSPTARVEMNGSRENGIRAERAYKARPLDGIWATPPYLHNGSVPTVFDLLSPAGDRPKSFCTGTREYDPLRMGLKTIPGGDCPAGMTNLDTSIKGNLNIGHEFSKEFDPARGEHQERGVIGRFLSLSERLDLIEYLKTDEINGPISTRDLGGGAYDHK